MFLLSGHLFLLEADPVEPFSRDELEDQAPDEGERGDGSADSVVAHRQRVGPHVFTTELDDEHLDAEGEDYDEDEHEVVEEVGEHVELSLSELTCVDLVEELHEDEGLEDDSVALNLGGRLIDHPFRFRTIRW